MDILSIQPNTLSVEILHPSTHVPIGLTLELQSLESDAVKAVERQIKNKTLKSGRNNVTAEKIDDNTVALLSAAIVGWTWTGDANLGGDKKPGLSPANKAKVVGAAWIAKQIDAALGDEAAFFAS